MFSLKGRSRFLDLTGSVRLYYVLAIGAFISVLTFIVYRDIMVTLTMIACTITSYFLLSKPPKEIVVSVDEDVFTIDETVINWENCIDWSVTDLGNTLEFVIHTNKVSQQYYYFYLSDESEDTKSFILLLSDFLPYNERVSYMNPIHNVLRNWGLK
jgi:hypothetical protein